MLYIVTFIIAAVAAVVFSRMRKTTGANAASLGWMSQQWLAEHRASHSD